MPQSLANVLLYIVFSTKNRTPFLVTNELRAGMNAYMVGTLRNIECPSLIVNCVDDHLHCLCQPAQGSADSALGYRIPPPWGYFRRTSRPATPTLGE